MFSILEAGTQSAPVEHPPAPAMAFTIDFSTGDAKMGDKDSLSKFRPAKGRRSFRSRSLKQKSEDADDDRQVGGSTLFLEIFRRRFCRNKYLPMKNSQKGNLMRTNCGNIYRHNISFSPNETCLIFTGGSFSHHRALTDSSWRVQTQYRVSLRWSSF